MEERSGATGGISCKCYINLLVTVSAVHLLIRQSVFTDRSVVLWCHRVLRAEVNQHCENICMFFVLCIGGSLHNPKIL